jgi:hypothetical protein
MDRVIVTIKREGDSQSRDLEVPTNMPVRQMASIISRALGWEMDAQGRQVQFQVGAQPPGRILQDEETLADVQAWDGAWLIFYEAKNRAGSGTPAQGEQALKGLVGHWTPLNVPQASQDVQVGPQPDADDARVVRPSGSGGWKQMDD